MRRVAAIALAVLAVAFCLAACGGGGSSGTTSARPTTPAAARAPQTPAEVAAERRAAGRAAAFVKADTDNSVPTFGSEAAGPERRGAQRALATYLTARHAEDWRRACRGLAKTTREGFEKLTQSKIKGCPAILAALSKGDDLGDPLVSGLLSLRVHGANAFALFYGPDRQQYFVPMLREGGAWKLTQLEPIAYPPAVAG